MSDDPPFEPPAITDEDIRWASRLLFPSEDAFHGKDGRYRLQDVLKSMESIDVAACPGSGKTTLLVAKLAILATKWQHRTRGICVLSHTNAARHEIEGRLGNRAAGQRLLAYPHFIGTIHGFVNGFLAIPWLRSRGYPIEMIDTGICERRRWWCLDNGSRSFLDNNRMDESSIRIVDASFNFMKKRGKLPFAKHTKTYRDLQTACRETAEGGYHCYDDMFIWARDLMGAVPAVVAVLRDRFPLLYIDEAQDNSEEQSAILHDVFIARDNPVKRQRFGDPNQAIFSFAGDEGATTDRFPDDTIRKDLPNSHRFGQKIADLADPLGIIPYKLVGQGPKKPLASGKPDGRHTIFLFDENGAGRVLAAYGRLLIETFSEQELRDGDFRAVGQVHKLKGDDRKPRHVGHYWPDYDPELAGPNPKPRSFVQYLFAGQTEAKAEGETYPAVEKIAEGILRLAGLRVGRTAWSGQRHRHRTILQLLESETAPQACYKILVARFGLGRRTLTEVAWDSRWRAVVREIAEAIAGEPLSTPEANDFLAWNVGAGTGLPAPTIRGSRDNIYRHPNDAPKVQIRVGSIHSVKGETHTATLVLETFWNKHSLEALLPWLNGSKSGSDSARTQQTTRLKLHYVAMTRPTHLLCLAMKRSMFESEDGHWDQSLIEDLERHGWCVKVI